ncbi:MAG: GspE/PulE family protein [Actinomycetota bacterium]
MLLAQILERKGLISSDRAKTAPIDPVGDEQFARSLVEAKEISWTDFVQARAEKLGLPFIDLSDFNIDHMATALVPGELARRHEVLPLRIEQDELFLGMTNPSDIIAIDDVRAASGKLIRPVLVEKQLLLESIARNYRMGENLSDVSSSFDEDPIAELAETETSASDAPIVRFVNAVIGQAIQDRASDIHIEPEEHVLRIRYRIDGVLHEMQRESKKIQPGVISRIKIMSDIDIAERRKPQDGRMTFGRGDDARDLRVATLPTVWGEKIILRILDKISVANSIEDLGFLEHNRKIFDRAIKKTNGMILVTGPTGSGKSTTLYTTLTAVSTPEINIITVEDPVEARIEGINQIQVNPRAGLTFASALRSILRADPDVVLVGEIRDRETAQIAMEASLTGHLVLSTLHTNSAPSTVTRLVELGVEPFLVASSVSTVIAQRLARRLCLKCRKETTAPESILRDFNFDQEPKFYSAVGCSSCSKTGYRGRLAFHEVMEVTEEVAIATMERESASKIEDIAISQGMISLKQDGLTKAAMGLTSIEEVFRVVD